jgi:hypothetical protein
MKKSFVFTALLMLGIGAKAIAGGDNISYVKTSDRVYFGQDIRVGLFNSKIISSDGTVTKVPRNKITAYMDGTRLFEYLPVMDDNNQVICNAMMEYITSRSGLRLYRYDSFDGLKDQSYYFLFKDGTYYLRVNQANALTVLPFFGIKDIKFSQR